MSAVTGLSPADEAAMCPARVPLPLFRPAGAHFQDPVDRVRLSLSESGYGCSPLALRAIQEQLANVHRYPDPTAGRLAATIAEVHEVTPAHVIVGNGIDELLLLAALALITPAAPAVVCANTYTGHANAVGAARATPCVVPLRGNRVDVGTVINTMRRGSLVYVCNPHNPTGSALGPDELAALVQAARARQAILVLDEAYIEYTQPGETCSAVGYVRDGAPVIVLRTFSKLYGLAGLRCGYALAWPSLADELRKLKNVLVFNVNRLALAAAEASLHDASFPDRVRTRTRRAIGDFRSWAAAWPWATALPSVTNFVLIELPWPAARVAAELACRGVLVRGGGDLGFPNHIRVSAGTMHEMATAGTALCEVADRLGQGRLSAGDAPAAAMNQHRSSSGD